MCCVYLYFCVSGPLLCLFLSCSQYTSIYISFYFSWSVRVDAVCRTWWKCEYSLKTHTNTLATVSHTCSRMPTRAISYLVYFHDCSYFVVSIASKMLHKSCARARSLARAHQHETYRLRNDVKKKKKQKMTAAHQISCFVYGIHLHCAVPCPARAPARVMCVRRAVLLLLSCMVCCALCKVDWSPIEFIYIFLVSLVAPAQAVAAHQSYSNALSQLTHISSSVSPSPLGVSISCTPLGRKTSSRRRRRRRRRLSFAFPSSWYFHVFRKLIKIMIIASCLHQVQLGVRIHKLRTHALRSNFD